VDRAALKAPGWTFPANSPIFETTLSILLPIPYGPAHSGWCNHVQIVSAPLRALPPGTKITQDIRCLPQRGVTEGAL